jgi:hypothetical protein
MVIARLICNFHCSSALQIVMRPIVRMDNQSDVPFNISNGELGNEKKCDFKHLMQSANSIPPEPPLAHTSFIQTYAVEN